MQEDGWRWRKRCVEGRRRGGHHFRRLSAVDGSKRPWSSLYRSWEASRGKSLGRASGFEGYISSSGWCCAVVCVLSIDMRKGDVPGRVVLVDVGEVWAWAVGRGRGRGCGRGRGQQDKGAGGGQRRLPHQIISRGSRFRLLLSSVFEAFAITIGHAAQWRKREVWTIQ